MKISVKLDWVFNCVCVNMCRLCEHTNTEIPLTQSTWNFFQLLETVEVLDPDKLFNFFILIFH